MRFLAPYRWKFGSKTEDQRWRRSWKTASFPRNTAPAPATPWPATLHSPRPSGTHRVPPGRTVYSHKASTRRLLTFWKTRGHGTPQPAAPWLPTCRPLTQYSIRWLLERGRYIEKKEKKENYTKQKTNLLLISFPPPSMGLVFKFQRNMQCIWWQS